MHWSYHYITSRFWNNLPDYVRRAPSLNIFKSLLDEVNLSVIVTFVHSLDSIKLDFLSVLLIFVYILFFIFISSYNLYIFFMLLYFIYLFHFIIIIFIFFCFDMHWVYSNLARSRLNESCTHPCNVDK